MPALEHFNLVKKQLEKSACVDTARLIQDINSSSKEKQIVVNEEHDYNAQKTYMERDIFEQPTSARSTLEGRVDFKKKRVNLREIENHVDDILRCKRLIVVGAGSSYHVAIGTRQIIEELVELPVFTELASDFLDRQVPIFRDDVCIFISQSGETSSILQACRYCKQRDALTMAITNTEESSLSDLTDFNININAGPEYGVTSTKSYSSQFLAMVLFALQLASDKKPKQTRIQEIINELEMLPSKIEIILQCNAKLQQIVKGMKDKKSVLVMGRGYQQASSLEGSFKLKEVSNIHSEGIHSGELKHGPLALIDDQIPIIMIIMRDAIYDKCMNAVQQVKARKGRPILICEKGDDETSKMADQVIEVPKTVDCLAGILTIVPLQLLSLHLALLLDKNVDNPAALVKTVVDA